MCHDAGSKDTECKQLNLLYPNMHTLLVHPNIAVSVSQCTSYSTARAAHPKSQCSQGTVVEGGELFELLLTT